MPKYKLILSLIVIATLACSKLVKHKNSKDKSELKNDIRFLIKQLKKDSAQHENVGQVLSEDEIVQLEKSLGEKFPESYRIFLKEFGNGAYWLYHNGMNDITKLYKLNSSGRLKMKSVEYEDGKFYSIDSLLCLMSEDSNGGAWVWLTSEKSEDGEWPLAYYSFGKLYYKVENFTEWLNLLIKCKHEVIRELDIDDKLGLG